MKVSDFTFELPFSSIAQFPLAERTSSRLMVINASGVQHQAFTSLLELLHPGDLLVLNNSRVIPARLKANKMTGGSVEILIERLEGPFTALAHVRASKSVLPGAMLRVQDSDDYLEVLAKDRNGLVRLSSKSMGFLALLQKSGEIPIPPYLKREATPEDTERYQTVYAAPLGSVAAPTAGLHFDDAMLKAVAAKGVKIGYVTLHVGAGTFLPIRSDQLESHRLHEELIEVSEEICALVKSTKEQGGRVVAVGTTTVRALETAARANRQADPRVNRTNLSPYKGGTTLFIKPGDPFYVVDVMITNFHLPESSLLMLVCAFGGTERVLSAYRQAPEQGYRFYSYGDSMWVERDLSQGSAIEIEKKVTTQVPDQASEIPHAV